MNDYIKQLKDHWKSKDLVFIATFKRINKTAGFFNHFTNPVSKMKLYYPEFKGVEVLDNRVSFYYGNNSTLIDGAFYKVGLNHTDNPKGKNNPYSLVVKNVSTLSQSKAKEILSKGIQRASTGLKYLGSYHKTSETFAAFNNIMLAETGEILMFQGESQKVYVSPKIELIEGGYYSFSMIENEGKLPSAISKTIIALKTNPYQEYIRLRFERLNNPEANKMIANLMREIGKGMYSSKQRMIFELLQNADDAPGKEKVEFHIDINGEYFFVMHDGAPFNKDDVEAITSAAESTKRGDSKKTGYKGIGFKSVFTDSTEVWLKSGGYQFAFLRSSVLFEDFDRFYFGSERYVKYPELLQEDKLKYRNQRLRFNGSSDIPWQVIPIWKENLPHEFSDSNFSNFNNPVQFALRLGENNIDDYKLAIDNIAKRPQFLLFLRNTSKFNARKNGVMILRTDNAGVIEILKLKGEEKREYFYTKKTYENIEVSDTAFEQLNIGLKKQSKINDYNEVTHYFTDLEGREIETIPPKLASASHTEISFGISLIENKISPEQDYMKELLKYSSLFTYLPMEDTRFQLPFLVNADFVPSSDRQRIQGDNLWNKYIMIKVAEKHIETLFFYANEFIKNKSINESYLSLLLMHPLPEDDTAQQIIESYNSKYLEGLKSHDIVVNDNNQTQLLSNTIIDSSGLIELFGQTIFYEIIQTKKRLPHSKLNSKYLKEYKYLDIEIIDLEKLAKQITPAVCEKMGIIIAENSLYSDPEFLNWLNNLVKYIPDNFGKIPFIVHNNSLFSLETLIAEDDAWLINKNTSDYEGLIRGLGYHTIDLSLVKYSNINGYLNEFNDYLNDRTLAYNRIAKKDNLLYLPITTKIKLIDFFKHSEFMVGIGETKYYGELKLFTDENGKARPLRQLIGRQEEIKNASIHQFRIDIEEYNLLEEELKKELIAKEEIFTLFILNTDLFKEWANQFNSDNLNKYIEDLKDLYIWVENTDEISSADWASIPWMYIDEKTGFITADKVYWSNGFSNISTEHFETVKSVLHRAEIKTLPLQACGEIIHSFKLKTDDSSNIDWSKIKEIEMLTANILLDWLGLDGSFGDFFEEYTLKIENNGLYSISAIEEIQIFDGSNKGLTSYIRAHTALTTLFVELDKELCCENRDMVGLLQGDKLLKAIIDSGTFDQNLAVHLPSKTEWQLLDNFISNLSVFNIHSGTEYSGSSPEHIIISNLLKTTDDTNAVSEENFTVIENLKRKVRINTNPLSKYDLSNRITFGTGDNRKVLNLSDVLEGFIGESDILDNLIESFVSIADKRKLRKFIFKTRQMQLDEIHYKIEEEVSSYYSVHQVVFQILDKIHGGNREWSRQRFNDFHLSQGNETQLKSSYQAFLDTILELDFTDLSDFNFHDLILNNCVDKNFAIESEVNPEWLEEWIDRDQTIRLKFISKLGYNGTDSAIVKLRKAAISKTFDAVSVIGHYANSKENIQITWNTIKWLSSFSSPIITQNIELIKQINNSVTLTGNDLINLTIPIIEAINNDGIRMYSLKSVECNSLLYLLPENEEFDSSIYTAMKGENENSIIIDSICGEMSTHFEVETISLLESINKVVLEKNSKLWEEPFYKKWEHYNEYPIYIYHGNEIPYIRTFKEITINDFTSDLKVVSDSQYYVSNVLIKDILEHLPDSFPRDMLLNLKEWERKTLKNEALLDEDSFDYKENIDRLLQDRLGISEEDQKRESGNAKTHAVYYLDENGYDVSSVNNEGPALTNILGPDGKLVNCIVRSAKGGLLYLDQDHWDMLEDDLMYLIVIYPGNSPRLFKNRLELLEEKLAENVLFKVPNNKFPSEIDGVFNALESESHLILVTSEKMKESLFTKLRQKRDYNKDENAAFGDDNFTF